MTWYVAITNPNCQRRAEAGLSAIGYQSFCPRLRKWVSHARTKIAKEYPILGRYLFVEVPDGAFGSIRSVHGIEAFVTDGSGVPAPVPNEVVWAFRQRYMRGEWDYVINETGEFVTEDGEIVTRRNPIPHGALVRIMEGQFANMLAVIRGHQNGKLKFLPVGRHGFEVTHEENVRAA